MGVVTASRLFVAVVPVSDAQVDKDETEDDTDIAQEDDAEERVSDLLERRRL